MEPSRYILLITKTTQLLYACVCKSCHANYLRYYAVSQSAREIELMTYDPRHSISDCSFAYGGQDYKILQLLLVSPAALIQQSRNMSSYSETTSGECRYAVCRVVVLKAFSASWESESGKIRRINSRLFACKTVNDPQDLSLKAVNR